MNTPRRRRVSLLWRILFSTSIAITILFIALGWVVQNQFVSIAQQTVEEEIRASFEAYQSLWEARADQLASVSLVLSRMPDVRGAFSTRDEATIRDTAREVWDQLSRPETLFLVCDPNGAVIAPVAAPRDEHGSTPPELRVVRAAAESFPSQARGFVDFAGQLYQIVITPVYVATSQDAALLNVLVAGIAVDSHLVGELKSATGGSEFVFLAHGELVASTLAPETETLAAAASTGNRELRLGTAEFIQSVTPLDDVEGSPVGELRILRPFDAARQRIAAVRYRLFVLWGWAILAGIGFTYVLVRRVLKPIADLDSAAVEIAQGNYEAQVPARGAGEIGRLAETFNTMSASLRKAREELIRQERISTIGRLSTSIVHDLRNPLAAIYGGSEMLVDGNLSEPQVKRLAGNIYKASRQVQGLLQELADAAIGRGHAREVCRLKDVIQAACDSVAASAEAAGVQIGIDVPDGIELPLDRSPMERVFQNLITNAIQAMRNGGSVTVRAEQAGTDVMVSVVDNGPGVPEAISSQLFQPFVTAGKKNGVGLGLALSRRTILAHGGDLWAEPAEEGARFVLRLPG